MRIAIFSDTHLGYGLDTPRAEDSFRQAKEALEIAQESELILIAGDIFHDRVPRQETLARALGMFSRSKVPIVAIYGTHERRTKGYINPVQTMEHAGLVTCLHCSGTSVRTGGETVNVFGMSGVPEAHAREVLEKWAPKPEAGGSLNILMLHQNIGEYIYSPLEPDTLKLGNLPRGFDLIIGGHIHWRDISKTPDGTPVLFPGSTIRTQLKKVETEPKGVTFFSRPDKFEFVPLKTQRKFFYEKIDLEGASQKGILEKVRERLSPLDTEGSLVRLKLSGTLEANLRNSDIDLRPVLREFKDCLLSIDKSFDSEKQKRESEVLKLRESSRSIEEMGLSLLESELGSDQEELFALIRDGRLKEATEKLLSLPSLRKKQDD